MSIGGGPMQAYCLVQGGPLSGRYTIGSQGCALGKSNQHGAIDSPGEEDEIAMLYAEDDAEPTDGSLVEL
jgi:hypothetical protein